MFCAEMGGVCYSYSRNRIFKGLVKQHMNVSVSFLTQGQIHHSHHILDRNSSHPCADFLSCVFNFLSSSVTWINWFSLMSPRVPLKVAAQTWRCSVCRRSRCPEVCYADSSLTSACSKILAAEPVLDDSCLWQQSPKQLLNI